MSRIFGFNRVAIIAEAGVNHNGDMALARELIRVAKACGADCIKFQTWVTEDLVTRTAPKAAYQTQNDGVGGQFEMLKRLEISYSDFRSLKKYAEETGISFLSTPDESRSFDFLANDLRLPIIKIGSGEIGNIPYLRHIGQRKIPVILSTGMSYLADIEKSYYTLVNAGCPQVAILHCTSEYPAPYDSINLLAMNTLKNAFGTEVGYSDHTQGTEISVAAVALGATIIEKHFTLDKNMKGPDHSASLDPSELKLLVTQVRHLEMALGDGIKKPHQKELLTKQVVSKGLYAARDLKVGETISLQSVSAKRPVEGIPASQFEWIEGKPLNRDIRAGQPILFSDIQF